MSRPFHLGDILSITTHYLLSPRGVTGVYDILRYMTGDDVFTVQITRVVDECAEPLLMQHPDLKDVQVPPDLNSKEEVLFWLDQIVELYGETREVEPRDPKDHTHIDVFTEMRKVAPQAEVLTFLLPE